MAKYLHYWEEASHTVCRLQKSEIIMVGFEVHTVVIMKSSIFLGITPRSPLNIIECLEERHRPDLPCPWRWRQHVPLKRWLTFNGLHSIISQKTELFRNYNASTWLLDRKLGKKEENLMCDNLTVWECCYKWNVGTRSSPATDCEQWVQRRICFSGLLSQNSVLKKCFLVI
jgi:hypothetical protein